MTLDKSVIPVPPLDPPTPELPDDPQTKKDYDLGVKISMHFYKGPRLPGEPGFVAMGRVAREGLGK